MRIRDAFWQSHRNGSLELWCGAVGMTLALLFALCPIYADATELNPDRAGIAYGTDPLQTFDLWLPKPVTGPVPVLIFFHGGGFIRGDKQPARGTVLVRMLGDHIAVLYADYRLAPRAVYPAAMLDGARVVQYVRAHHAELGIDPDRIAVMGTSAGGGIALWVAFHSDLSRAGSTDPVEHASSRVAAAIVINAQATYAAPTIEQRFHTRQMPELLAEFFGAPSVQDLWKSPYVPLELDASPVTHMHAGEPPVLAFYLTNDSDMPPDSMPGQWLHNPAQGRYLEEVAHQKGAQFTMRTPSNYAGGNVAAFLDEAVKFLNTELHR